MPGHKNCHKKDCHKKCDCKSKNREFGQVKAASYQTKSKTFTFHHLKVMIARVMVVNVIHGLP